MSVNIKKIEILSLSISKSKLQQTIKLLKYQIRTTKS